MATHSSVLAWRIPGTGEPVGLLSMGSHRVGHDWSDLAAVAAAPTLGSPGTWHLPFFQHLSTNWVTISISLSYLSSWSQRLHAIHNFWHRGIQWLFAKRKRKKQNKTKHGAGLFWVVETQTFHFSTLPTIIMEKLMWILCSSDGHLPTGMCILKPHSYSSYVFLPLCSLSDEAFSEPLCSIFLQYPPANQASPSWDVFNLFYVDFN